MLEREVTRDDPEWAAAMASLTVSEMVKIMPSIRQHKDNERDCRTIVQQLVSSIPREVLTSTSYKWQEQGTTYKRKALPLMTSRRQVKKLVESWSNAICPGRLTVRRKGEFRIKTRDKKVCPQSQT